MTVIVLLCSSLYPVISVAELLTRRYELERLQARGWHALASLHQGQAWILCFLRWISTGGSSSQLRGFVPTPRPDASTPTTRNRPLLW